MTSFRKLYAFFHTFSSSAVIGLIATPALSATTTKSGGTTAGAIASGLTTQVTNVGKLVVIGAFLVGVIFIGAGLMKLKQAADTQGQQVKYGEGLWRLVVGGGLVAVPAVTGMLAATFGLDAAAVANSPGF
jgi:hypothetical protein